MTKSNSDEDVKEEDDLSQQRDGMADMMSRILSQSIDSKVPVLAKRKTAMMKAIEEEVANSRKAKRMKAAKPVLPTNVKLAVDQDGSIEFERQLRKLATRGVVALFNAISASKQVIIAENSKKDESKEKHAKEKLPDDDLASRISSIKDIKSTRQPVRNSKWNALSEDTSATSATLKNWDQESSDDEISKS